MEESTTPLATSVSLFKCIAGCGVLAMPYGIMRAGVLSSLLILAIVWSASVRTIRQVCTLAIEQDKSLISFSPRMRDSPEKGKTNTEESDEPISYSQLCTAAFGQKIGNWLTWYGVIPGQYVGGVAYLIFVGENTAHVFAHHFNAKEVVIGATVLQCLLCLPRSTAYLQYTSSFGNMAFFSGLGCVLIYALHVQGLHPTGVVLGLNSLSGSFEYFGILSFAFSAHCEALAILSSAGPAAKKKFDTLIVQTFLFAVLVFVGFALTVYVAFGDGVQSVMFNMIPDGIPIVIVLRLAMSATIMSNYPLSMFPVFHVLESSFIDASQISWRLLGRSTIILSTGVVAFIFGDGFGPVTAVCGGLVALSSFILPPLFHLVLTPAEKVSTTSRFIDYAVIGMGVLGGALSIQGGLEALFTGRGA